MIDTHDFNTEQAVNFIISTYSELPQDRRMRLRRTGLALARRESLDSFTAVYELLAKIVEDNTQRWDISLETGKGNTEEERGLHNCIPDNKPTPLEQMISIEDPKESQGIPLVQAFETVSQDLSLSERRFFCSLMSDDKLNVRIAKEDLPKYTDSIKTAIDKLRTKFWKNGRLRLPKTPLTKISIFPRLSIGYEGGRLCKEDIQTIKNAYCTFDGDLKKATANLPFGKKTIKRHWINKGLEPKNPKRKLNDTPLGYVEQIIAAYDKYDGIATRAAEHLPVSRNTVLRYWREVGLESKGSLHQQGLPLSAVEEIVEAYEAYDGSATKAAKHLTYSKSTILKYWKEMEFKIRPPGFKK